MLKRKIGDKVIIRKDLVECDSYNGIIFGGSMIKYKGREAIINDYHFSVSGKLRYLLNIDNEADYWTDDMFENDDEHIHITKGIKEKLLPLEENQESQTIQEINDYKQDIDKYKELIKFLLSELEDTELDTESTLYYLEKLRPDLYKLIEKEQIKC